MKNRQTNYILLILFSIFLFSKPCFGFVPDPNVELYAETMHKKYFPIFLKTIRMINMRQFQDLKTYFSEKLLVDRKSSPEPVSIATLEISSEVYYSFRKTSSSSPDLGKKGFRILFPIDWGADPIKNSTWVLYFQNLSWIERYLKKGENGDTSASLLAFKVIDDWIVSNAQWPAKYGKLVYEDHSVAKRLEIFYRAMRLYQTSPFKDESFFQLLLTGILNHVALMSSKERYSKWHNHRIILDLALMRVMDNFREFRFRNETLELAEKRIVEQFKFAYTSEGVHKEHSPCYHYFVTNMLINANDLIRKSGRPVPAELQVLEDKTSVFHTYVLEPDTTFPNIGDCSGAKIWRMGGMENRYIATHPELIYSLSSGKKGMRPSEVIKIFSDSGWAIFRDRWPADLYAAIQSDYHSRGHYQEDDTSFVLKGFGHDLIIDPGLHSYDTKPLDIYMRKSRAHNVLIVDGLDFNSRSTSVGLSGITRFALNESPSERWRGVVELTHPHYRHMGVKINRQFGQIDEGSFVIRDVIASKRNHRYSQLFHLGPGALVEPDTDGVFRVSWKDHDVVLWLKSDFESYDIIEGSMNPVQGWHFPTFGVSETHPVLRLHKQGNVEEFKTYMSAKQGDTLIQWEGMMAASRMMQRALEDVPRRRLKKQFVPRRWEPFKKIRR